MSKHILLYTLLLIVVNSCKTDNKQSVKESNKLPVNSYSLKKGSKPAFTWTAFKFSNRMGVSGTFDSIQFKPSVKRGTVKDLFKNATFSIQTASINSNLDLRDKRIISYFFSRIEATTISGTFLEVNATNGKLAITIGENSNTCNFNYCILENIFILNTSIDLTAWHAEAGIKSLNKICKIEHTGTDGISKLWNDVAITVKIELNSFKLLGLKRN